MSLILSGTTGISGSAGVIDAQTLSGQANTYYTNITARLGYTPLSNVNPSYTGTLTGDSASFSTNLNFTATGNRITGDFSNANIASRVLFQTSTTNGATYVSSIPNGTASAAGFQAFASSTDPNNTSIFQTRVALDNNECAIYSTRTGTGTYLPITFYTAGNERMRLDTSGNLGISTNSPNAKLSIGGRIGSGLYYINGTNNTFTSDAGIRVSVSNTGNASISGGLDLSNNAYSVGSYSPIISFSSLSTNGSFNNAYGGIYGILEGVGTDNNWVKGGLVFATSSSAGLTERIRITSQGNLGIGLTSPLVPLHVKRDSATWEIIQIENGTATSGAFIRFVGGPGGTSDIGAAADAANEFIIRTNSIERIRIDSSGNFGVGTSDPSYRFHVVGRAYINPTASDMGLEVIGSAGNVNQKFDIDISKGGGAYQFVRIASGGNNIFSWGGSLSAFASLLTINNPEGAIAFNTGNQEQGRIGSIGLGIGTNNPALNSTGKTVHIHAPTGQWSLLHTTNGDTGSAGNDGSIFGQIGTDAYAYNYEAGNLIFGTSSSEKMRIASDGSLRLGATAAQGTSGAGTFNLYVTGGDAINLNHQVAGNHVVNISQVGAGTSNFFYLVKNGTQAGVISCSPTSTTYGTTSDYRLKYDPQRILGALDKVLLLNPVTFKWTVDDSLGEGFIAHELQSVCPSAVTGKKDGVDKNGEPVYQTVDSSYLVATLTAAIQEMKQIIDQQDARIKTLEGKV